MGKATLFEFPSAGVRSAFRKTRGDYYHAVANPAKGEPIGGRGLPNHGY
jgi:hypothetical protein